MPFATIGIIREPDSITEKQQEGGKRRSAEQPAAEARAERPGVPRLSNASVLDRYSQAAREALVKLGNFARNLESGLGAKEEPGAAPPQSYRQRGSPGASPRLRDMLRNYHPPPIVGPITPEEFSALAQGHEMPARVLREGDFSADPSLLPRDNPRFDGYCAEIAANWLPAIVGPEISARLAESPPHLAQVQVDGDMSGSELFLAIQLLGAAGGYLPDSNAILLPDGALEFGDARSMELLLHELLHYASWLGGGQDIRWQDSEGACHSRAFRRGWSMHEGLTELIAQQETRSRGFEPEWVYYPAETISCFYMQQLLGEGGDAILRTAYLTGDFTQVRSLLDSVLGAGSFDELAAKGSAALALSFLEGRIDEAGIDRAAWDGNPIAVLARSRMDERGGLQDAQ